MSRILAIALLTFRSAVRSRVLLLLLGLLLLAVVGLPLTVKGDGTIAGRVQILLSYTLGFAGVIVSIATVWAGCAAVSVEVQQRQIHLVMTKPVHALELWLGKWFGLLLLNAVLIGFAGTAVYGLLRWTTRPALLAPEEQRLLREEILVARTPARPRLSDLDTAARALLDERQAAGQLPPSVPPEQLLKMFRREALVRAMTVAPGARRTWTFELPFVPEPGRPAHLQFRFAKSELDMEGMTGLWTVAAAGGGAVFERAGSYRPDAVQTLVIPAESVPASRTLVIGFENRDPTGATLVFDPEGGLELLAFRGTFAGNFLRALLATYCQLAFFAAIGLSAGALLSLPVASFAAVGFLLVLKMSGYIGRMAAEETYFFDPSNRSVGAMIAERFVHYVFIALDTIMSPLQGPDTLDLLATGRLVSWEMTGRAFAADIVVYGGLLAIVCAWLFRRRELAVAP